MNRHSIRVLEFEKIREAVEEYCLTTEARAALQQERIRVDPAEVDTLVRRSSSARNCLQSTVEFPTLTFPPVSAPLATLQKEGSVLEPPEVASVALFVRSAGLLRSYFLKAASETDNHVLDEAVGAIPDITDVSDHLFRFVDPDGTVRERDIPVLKSIRSQINRAHQDLQREAQGLLAREDLRRYWNASVPTQREGRTVLPLKADHRGKVTGIVHEVSATGATIFLEPEVLVARNNAVTEALNRYQAELLRILRELSAYCREHLVEMVACLDAVVQLDMLYARARYAAVHECLAAESGHGTIRLLAARHPLLGKSAVPISIEFPAEKRLLVVTGPNTGGKTVSLKTVGLLALMNQFGMEVPAGPGTLLPVFTGIYADIGDEQSIEQSLSTFSGHMRNIGRILAAADESSLVLLDELGSGTDPEEGGALAMAILDELLARASYAVITTHHGALKHYGFTQPAAANASVEFDDQSLRPTFRIVPGVPGSSHAIEVAAHMGLLRRVTKAARTYLQGEDYDTGRIIRTLTDREQELHRERESLRNEREGLKKEIEALESERQDLSSRESELRDGRLRELDAWSAGARKELENLVREIREGELTREKTRRVKEFIRHTNAELGRQRREHIVEEKSSIPVEAAAGEAREGATIRLISAGKTGKLVRRGRSGKWQVQVGDVRMDVREEDFTVLADQKEHSPSISVSGISGRASLEIDLRGRRLDEALEDVSRQIDQALLSGVNRFGIIHGTGEGVLQKGVRDYLSRHPNVASYEFARPEDGGFGKTHVNIG